MNRKIGMYIEFSEPEKYYESVSSFKETIVKHIGRHLPYEIEFRIIDTIEVPMILEEVK